MKKLQFVTKLMVGMCLSWILLAQNRQNNELVSAVNFGSDYYACENVVRLYGFTTGDQPLYWSCVKVSDTALQ
jgi:hypothetical protein